MGVGHHFFFFLQFFKGQSINTVDKMPNGRHLSVIQKPIFQLNAFHLSTERVNVIESVDIFVKSVDRFTRLLYKLGDYRYSRTLGYSFLSLVRLTPHSPTQFQFFIWLLCSYLDLLLDSNGKNKESEHRQGQRTRMFKPSPKTSLFHSTIW